MEEDVKKVEKVEEIKKEEEVKKDNKQKEKKKSKKKIIIPIVVIIVLIMLIAGGLIFYHKTQTDKLIAEVNKMSETEMFNEDGSIKDNPIDMEIKTTGSYAVVEQELKNYLNEVLEESKKFAEEFSVDKIENLLSLENLKANISDLTPIKEEIKNLKEMANNYYAKMQELSDEETILNRINDKNVGEYYKKLYRNLAIDEVSDEEMKESMDLLKTSVEELNTTLEEVEEFLDDLS